MLQCPVRLSLTSPCGVCVRVCAFVPVCVRVCALVCLCVFLSLCACVLGCLCLYVDARVFVYVHFLVLFMSKYVHVCV